jgi:hypothetical protein
MQNMSKRAKLAETATAALEELDRYLEGADPSVIGAFRNCRNWLQDIHTFWLGSKLATPELSEAMWLNQAEHMLITAKKEARRLREMVDQHGGPKNAKFFG